MCRGKHIYCEGVKEENETGGRSQWFGRVRWKGAYVSGANRGARKTDAGRSRKIWRDKVRQDIIRVDEKMTMD